jgi:hypothetical protein
MEESDDIEYKKRFRLNGTRPKRNEKSFKSMKMGKGWQEGI